jgi:mannose-6-phosphate isomerase-like protein (cupin superfamily)
MPHPCVIPWNEAAAQRHDRGFMLPFVNEKCGAHQLRLHVSVMNPGQAPHPPHQHAGEEIIFLLEGTGEITIGEDRVEVQPMTAIFLPDNARHSLRNTGAGPMKYLVVRVP